MAGSSTGGSLITDKKLRQLYATMLQCRLLTEHARGLRNQRRAFYSASMGQEAIATGCAIDLLPEDTVTLAPNDSIAGLVKGMALKDIVARLYARPSSSAGSPAHNILNPCSDGCAQLQVATTVALANKQKNNSNVVVAFTSAAATATSSARDDWHELLQHAAKRSLPIMFVVENNPWPGFQSRNGGVSLTRNTQRAGLTNIMVDGNDVVAVYRVAHESLERVRQGGGPVLVEGKTYRQDGQAVLAAERDPLIHMERYLRTKKLFTARWKNQLVDRFSQELDAAVKEARYLRASQPAAND